MSIELEVQFVERLRALMDEFGIEIVQCYEGPSPHFDFCSKGDARLYIAIGEELNRKKPGESDGWAL